MEMVNFFGGEPLLNVPVIKVFVETLKNKNIIYSLVTNATKVSDELLNLLNKYNIKVIASLDGPKEIHDENRVYKLGGGTFDLVDANIKKIKEKTNALSMIESVYTLPTYKKMSKLDLYEYIYNRYKVKNIGIGNVVSNDIDMKLPEKCKNEAIDNIDRNIEYTINKILNREFIPINEVNDILTVIVSKRVTNFFCGAGLVSIFIDEVGDICPCQLFTNDPKHYMGNIFSSYDKLSENLRKIQKLLQKKNVKENIKECNKCVCNFWCFKCIGQNKDNENYGCCNKTECSYYKVLTLKILDKVAYMISNGEFTKLLQAYSELSENILV